MSWSFNASSVYWFPLKFNVETTKNNDITLQKVQYVSLFIFYFYYCLIIYNEVRNIRIRINSIFYI